jgi:hypothetical protein
MILGRGNKKLSDHTITVSLPAGYSCPAALSCFAIAHRDTGKISDGVNSTVRCFSAMTEAIFPSVRKSRWDNFIKLKNCKTIEEMVSFILPSINSFKFIKYVRLHVSGDFFSELYFLAWLEIARLRPDLIFYGYTKRCDLLVKFKNSLPVNFRMVASYGGKYDGLIKKYNLIHSKIVMNQEEAMALNLKIDLDDSMARKATKSFALLIHGAQKKNTPASKYAFKNRKSKV